MQFWNESAIHEENCPKCSGKVEFYKDDTNRKCDRWCGHRMINPHLDFSCAAYCQFAERCVGTLPEEFVGQQDNLLKDWVAVEVKRYLKSDFRRISYTTRVAQQADKIARNEGANLGVTLCAAYLLDIGKVEAAGRYGNPTTGRVIAVEASKSIIQGVCTLIAASHHQRGDDSLKISLEIQVLADAVELAQLEEIEMRCIDAEQAREYGQPLMTRLRTASGRQLTQKMVESLAKQTT